MNKIKSIVWKIAYDLGILIVGIQILLALCWIFKNLWLVPDFSETLQLLEMSETWVLDEYVGAAYVALVFCAKTLQKWIGIPFQMMIYLMQLGLSVFAVYKLFESALKTKIKETDRKTKCGKLLAASAYVNTIPFVLQAHMSVLPYSLASSLYLLLVATLLDMMKKADCKDENWIRKTFWHQLSVLVLLWTVSALILPEYRFFSGIVIFFCLLYVGINRKELRGWIVIGVMVGALCSAIFPMLTIKEGSRGRMQNTFEAQAMRRFAWPYLEQMESVWPWEIIVDYTKEELEYMSATPERVISEFGPQIENKYGKEKANELYYRMAKNALTYNARINFRQTGADMLFYLCPFPSIIRGLNGEGATYTGENYEKLQSEDIYLTKWFVNWATISAVVMCAIFLFACFERRMKMHWIGVCALSVMLQTMYYTWTTAGMVDYLKSPVNLIIWGIIAVSWLWAIEERGADAK